MDTREHTDMTKKLKSSEGSLPSIRWALSEAAYVAAAAALGRAQLPFGAFPFGFSALCASGGHAVSVFIGLGLSLIGRSEPFVYLAAYALTLLLRAVVCAVGDGTKTEVRFFREHISFRLVACSVGAFGVGLYRLLVGGFLYYDLFGAIIGIVVSALAAALMYPLEKKQAGVLSRAVGLTVLLCCVTWGLRGIDIFGVSLSASFAMLVSLAVTRKKGLMHGTLTAIATGICVSVGYAPLFVFSAIIYRLLSGITPFFGALASLGTGLAWGIYIDGISALSELLPALILANFAFLAVDRLYLTQNVHSDAVEASETLALPMPSDVSLVRFNDAAGRIKHLCEGFSALSEMLMRADIANADDALLYEIGELGEGSEDSLRMAYYGGYLADSLRSAALAAEFRAISEYLAGIMTENEQSFSSDRDAENKIREIFEKRLPERALSVSVLGKETQRIVISASDKSALNRDREEIRRAVTHACGFAVTEGETEELDGRAMLIFSRAPVLSATFAGRKRNSVGEEEFCGDSFGVIADEEKSFAFISDGMGSGREAAVTSGLCTLFLQKLLPINGFAGDCVSATLDALNGFLCGRNGAGLRECAATVDLASLDLVACKAVFYKCGAAPTYIFRDGALFKVRSRTVPIGIVREPDIGKINMELLPGDVIVMVSDGVTQGREECPELFELLRSRLLTHSSEQLADAVMDYAEQQGCTDDVSVLVIKISENDRIFSAAESA